jgi:hypothetical protein
MFLLLNNPSGTSFIGDVVTMEEVLICSNKILPSVMMMPLYGSQNGLNQRLVFVFISCQYHYRRFRFSAYPMLYLAVVNKVIAVSYVWEMRI